MRTRIIFHIVTSEYHSTFVLFDIEVPTPNSQDDKDPSMKRHELFLSYSLLHRSLFLVFDFRQLSCRNFHWFFHFFHHCCLCIWNFRCLRHRNEFVNKTVMIHTIHPFFSDVILVRFVSSSSQLLNSSFRRHQHHKHNPLCVSQHSSGFLHCSLSFFCKALLLASELPTFSERLSF